jgi:hypothetical protein
LRQLFAAGRGERGGIVRQRRAHRIERGRSTAREKRLAASTPIVHRGLDHPRKRRPKAHLERLGQWRGCSPSNHDKIVPLAEQSV